MQEAPANELARHLLEVATEKISASPELREGLAWAARGALRRPLFKEPDAILRAPESYPRWVSGNTLFRAFPGPTETTQDVRLGIAAQPIRPEEWSCRVYFTPASIGPFGNPGLKTTWAFEWEHDHHLDFEGTVSFPQGAQESIDEAEDFAQTLATKLWT